MLSEASGCFSVMFFKEFEGECTVFLKHLKGVNGAVLKGGNGMFLRIPKFKGRFGIKVCTYCGPSVTDSLWNDGTSCGA